MSGKKLSKSASALSSSMASQDRSEERKQSRTKQKSNEILTQLSNFKVSVPSSQDIFVLCSFYHAKFLNNSDSQKDRSSFIKRVGEYIDQKITNLEKKAIKQASAWKESPDARMDAFHESILLGKIKYIDQFDTARAQLILKELNSFYTNYDSLFEAETSSKGKQMKRDEWIKVRIQKASDIYEIYENILEKKNQMKHHKFEDSKSLAAYYDELVALVKERSSLEPNLRTAQEIDNELEPFRQMIDKD